MTHYTSDHENLKHEITERLKALLEKGASLRQIAEEDQIAPVAGLSQPEMAVLASAAGSVTPPSGTTPVHSTKNDAERAGLTSLASSLGLWRLDKKGLIEITQDADNFGNPYDVVQITDKGWSWIAENDSLFLLRRPTHKPVKGKVDYAEQVEISDDDIPF